MGKNRPRVQGAGRGSVGGYRVSDRRAESRRDPIVLILPEPPSSNRYWRRHGNVIHVSVEAKAYKQAVSMLTSRYRQGTEVAFPSGDLSITVLWHRSAKRGDLPNRTKILYDALEGTIYRDDKQIAQEWTLRVDEHAEIPKGFMRVEISHLDNIGTAA